MDLENRSNQSSNPESAETALLIRETGTVHLHSSEDSPMVSKVKFLCSYGGKIQPRLHDNRLSYVGGDTKIISVDRHVRLRALMSKLISLCGEPDVCFKYQLPGEELDSLVSVFNDEDLDHMMAEYDRLYKCNPLSARLRLFIFRLKTTSASCGIKLDQQWFVDALNSAPYAPQTLPLPLPTTQTVTHVPDLFGFETKSDLLHETVKMAGRQTGVFTASTKPTENRNLDQFLDHPVHHSLVPGQVPYLQEENAGGQRLVYLMPTIPSLNTAVANTVHETVSSVAGAGGPPTQAYFGLPTASNPLPSQTAEATMGQVCYTHPAVTATDDKQDCAPGSTQSPAA